MVRLISPFKDIPEVSIMHEPQHFLVFQVQQNLLSSLTHQQALKHGASGEPGSHSLGTCFEVKPSEKTFVLLISPHLGPTPPGYRVLSRMGRRG
jgi:hypothetical protein